MLDTYIPSLGSVCKPDEYCIPSSRNISLNILAVKVDKFTEVRAREEIYLNRRVIVVGSTCCKIVLGRKNIGLRSNKQTQKDEVRKQDRGAEYT